MLSSEFSKSFKVVIFKSTWVFQKQPPGVFFKKLFLEISQNSQQNTCAKVSSLIKLQAWGLQLY